MAKPKTLEFTPEVELEADFDAELEVELDADFDEDFADQPVAHLETENEEEETQPGVSLTPEQALEHLLALGKTKGHVSYDDVLAVMPDAESNMEQVEDIFASLFEQGIEVGQTREDEPDELHEMERIGGVRRARRSLRKKLLISARLRSMIRSASISRRSVASRC